ncbi:MAG: CrcB family protein [Akkermansiaceae bacterium]|nr:CrcB family protein [Akkermansiaceae bacterium]
MRRAHMAISLKTLLCIGCGCFAGGTLRYLTGVFISSRFEVAPPHIPWHTLVINFMGCLVMGIFCGLIHHELIKSPSIRAGLTAGLCGGYSTLAAFAWENTELLKAGAYLVAGGYMAATMLGGVLFFILGYLLAQALIKM